MRAWIGSFHKLLHLDLLYDWWNGRATVHRPLVGISSLALPFLTETISVWLVELAGVGLGFLRV
jgi:hypothetical protein